MLPVNFRCVQTIGVLALALGAPLDAAAQATSGGFAPGARTIVDLNFAGTPVGALPKGNVLESPQGKLEVVDKVGLRMLRAASPSTFVIPLPEALPTDFTVEFELVPKICCNPVDLMLAGDISGGRSSKSAQIEWDADHFAVVGGDTEMFQMDMPPAVIATGLAGALTKVAFSFEGETIKMYTNGIRVYTLTNRIFARDPVLHISLGGQDDDKYAVYLARVRIADAASTMVATAPINAIPAATTGTSVPMSPNATTTAQTTPITGVLVNPTTTGTISPSGAVTRVFKPSSVQCPAVTNLKAVANGPNAAVLSWTPMTSSCQTIAQAAGEWLDGYALTRWRTADSNGCPTDFMSLYSFTEIQWIGIGSRLLYAQKSPIFPSCVMKVSEE
ncbi:MAG TPA: hypothetical protein VFZ73_04555, partial [Gemmatimonadaceae bacterium]